MATPQKKERRISTYSNITIAVLLLLLLVVWQSLLAPALVSLSDDFSFSADIISIDDFYDEELASYTGGIYSKTEYRYETVSTENGVSIIQNSFNVSTPENQPIFSVSRAYGIDVKTGRHVVGYGDHDRDGYLFAPRHLKAGEQFTYWHVNYDSPARMSYVGTEFINKLRVFHYESRYEDTKVDQTANLKYLPGVGETRGVELDPHLEIWVEPVSGQLIKYRDDTYAYYYDLATGERLNAWNHFSNQFSEQSIIAAIDNARFEKVKILVVESYIPLVIILVALLFIARSIGFLIYTRERFTLVYLQNGVGILCLAVAILTLAGWLTGSNELVTFLPDESAMNPVTATLFILMGVGLIFKGRAHNSITFASGAVLMVLAVTRLAAVLGLTDIQIDLFLFPQAIHEFTTPARMAEYTAISFSLIGFIFITASAGILRRFRIIEIVSSIVFVTSSIALFAYLFDIQEWLSLPVFFSSAVHTSFLFLITSVATYFVFRDKESIKLRVKGILAVSGILFLTVIITIVFTGILERSLSQDARNAFSNEVDLTADLIEDRLTIYENALEGGKGLFASSDLVERSEWKTYVDTLDIHNNYPGIQGMAYAEFVTNDEKDEHIASIRSEGLSDYDIYPEGERDLYVSTIYIEPIDERNQQALGFDMFQEPVRRAAMIQARDSGQPRLSGRITLVQETDEDIQPGFIIYLPYYANGAPIETVEERRSAIRGYIYSPFRAHNFVEGAIGSGGIENIALRINDATLDTSESLLYDDYDKKITERSVPRFQDRRVVYFAGRPWTLSFYSSQSYGYSFYSRILPYFVASIGIGISILISLIFFSFASSKQRAEELAALATRDLRKSRDQLKKALSQSDARREELEMLNSAMVGRELKMVELKKKITELSNKDGREKQ